MDMDRYLTLIQADAELLTAASAGHLDDRVPSCPGWTVKDLVEHVAMVYQHKIACMRLQRAPEPWPPDPPGGDLVQWLQDSTVELLAELGERGPAAPSYTWHKPDQTVGFWCRRMAQETAVHRVDAQLARGGADPVDSELALDGVDELLDIFFAGDWSDLPQPELVGQIGLRAADRSWLVVLEPREVRIEALTDEPDAVVSATPSDLLLWLWGRLPVDAVQSTGDPEATGRLLQRLTHVTE